jgi:hypothetical protein
MILLRLAVIWVFWAEASALSGLRSRSAVSAVLAVSGFRIGSSSRVRAVRPRASRQNHSHYQLEQCDQNLRMVIPPPLRIHGSFMVQVSGRLGCRNSRGKRLIQIRHATK